MKKTIFIMMGLLLVGNAVADEHMITPADMSDEAQSTMHEMSMNYNKCMMQSRLNANNSGQQVQQAANDILTKCETHLEQLKTHLISNHVNEPLAIGMTKKMRSRGARELMTKGMNNMAAQASAVVNAEKIKAEKAQ